MQKMTLLSTQFFTIKIKNILFLCGGKESISTMNCCGKIHTYIYISGKYYFFSLFFGPSCAACGVLVPRPEMEPLPSALGAPSLRHWTAREIPGQYFWCFKPLRLAKEILILVLSSCVGLLSSIITLVSTWCVRHCVRALRCLLLRGTLVTHSVCLILVKQVTLV